MSDLPDISVLIPCYNAGGFLRETLESVLVQDVERVEVIAINDGSTDNTEEVLKSFGGRIRWSNQENAGVSMTRNRLMEQARGRYLQFLDADDLLVAGTLRKRLELAERSKADVVLCWWDLIAEDGTPLPQRQRSQRLVAADLEGDVELAAFTWLWVPPAAVFYGRELAQRAAPWRVDLPVIQDARFLLDALREAERRGLLEEVGAKYRVHQYGSVSTKSTGNFYDDVFRNALSLAEIWCSENSLCSERKNALGDCFEGVARTRLELGRDDFVEALKFAKKFSGSFKGKRLVLANTLHNMRVFPLFKGVFTKNKLTKVVI